MASMPTFGHPPTGYGWSDRASDLSALSTTTAFHRETELMDQRDQFLGICRCVICGVASESLEHCHVIMYSESHIVSENGI
jgi:hypothetical protein